MAQTLEQVNQEVAAQRYIEWQQHHANESGWQKAYEDISHMLPSWFLFSALIVGIITLGLIMLKVNPLLAPVKNAVLWLLKFWEKFLESSKMMLKK